MNSCAICINGRTDGTQYCDPCAVAVADHVRRLEEGVDECEFCRGQARTKPFLNESSNHKAIGGPRLRWFCRLCARTQAGNMAQFPERFDRQTQVLAQIICFIGNEILYRIDQADHEEKIDNIARMIR